MFTKSKSRATIALALSAVVLPLATSAVASPESLSATSTEVELPDSQEIDVHGELDADGNCQFDMISQRAAKGQVEVGLELTFNESNCTARYLIAVYPLDAVPSTVQEEVFGGSDEYEAFSREPMVEYDASLERTRNPGVADVSPMASHSSKLMIAYRDPLLLHVTRTTTTLTWTTSPPCVNSRTGGHETYQLSSTGWVRNSYTPSSTFSCSRAEANTVATFANDPFCPGSGNTTYTNHLATIVYGYPSGSSNWSRTMTKSGGCNNLLHTTYGWTP